MKRIQSHLMGIDQGDVVAFSDFKDDGPMWSGTGEREARVAVTFSDTFAKPPIVSVSLSMLDAATDRNVRTDVQAENITTRGCDLVFRTWGDTRIARARIAWQAIGELPSDDSWDL